VQDIKINKADSEIDAGDPDIKLFLRRKMAEGNTQFTDANVVLFLHGATGPSTCDFDLSYKDYSWADLMVKRGYVVYMGDYRNYGYSTREPAMDELAAKTRRSAAPIWCCAISKRWSITSGARTASKR
jgi:alpha-beta hydrolase superfamily lysophospholipase